MASLTDAEPEPELDAETGPEPAADPEPSPDGESDLTEGMTPH